MSNKFVAFSPRQKTILTWWTDNSPYKDYDGIIADGAIRSGKSTAMALSYFFWAMERFNERKFAICGVTVGALRRNIINDTIVVLERHGYKVLDRKGASVLYISRGRVRNEFYMFSGYDERSQDRIQGVTLAGCYFDEVALMPQSFINQATGRCSVEGAKFWFNCNPNNRLHWFKQEWINKYIEKHLLYLHFTMDDNFSLSEKVKERYRRMYIGVFYRRYIEGLWCAAEGVIYDGWKEEKNSFDAEELKPWDNLRMNHYVAVDYGTINPTVFLEAYDDGRTFYITKEYYQDSQVEQRQKTPEEHAADMDVFLNGNKNVQIIVDPSAAAFILELRNRGYRVKEGKNNVLEGIRTMAIMVNKGLLKVDKSCVNFRREIETYVWDDKAKQQGVEQPVKQNDHAMDACRYLIYTLTTRMRLDAIRDYY